MTEHLLKIDGPIDKESHLSRILYRFDHAEIVSIDDEDVGLLKSYCDQEGWHIVQVQVSQHHQGKGIGAKLVKHVIAHAKETKKNVSLSVIKGNPAKGLYERLGFSVISEDDQEFTMRYLCP